MLTLLTGGARSGKSQAAVRIASAADAAVHYVAVAFFGHFELKQLISHLRVQQRHDVIAG